MKPFCYHPFDLRQLVSFAEIARTGSFRQAAKTLHIAQPALSRQIKQLESAIGICLFDRAPRRLHLTIAGQSTIPDSLIYSFARAIEHRCG
ncbi:MAG: LysR family transcriptional regulator [Verrucomicrobia bacterium]|nr:LysR family transcriptional regulator [Verrucomicrobiota bacterium]